MVPLVRDRPLTMQRFPDGIDKPGFFQKEAPYYLPDWVKTVTFELRDGRRYARGDRQSGWQHAHTGRRFIAIRTCGPGVSYRKKDACTMA